MVSRNSVLGIVTRLRVAFQESGLDSPQQGPDINIYSRKRPNLVGGAPSYVFNGYRDLFLFLTLASHGSEWSVSRFVCCQGSWLRGMNRENFTFTSDYLLPYSTLNSWTVLSDFLFDRLQKFPRILHEPVAKEWSKRIFLKRGVNCAKY
jgi:hypothetical protein